MEDEKLIQFYRKGKSCREIGDYYNVSSQAVGKRLRQLGIKTRRVAGYYTSEELQALRHEISALRAQNLTILQIAEIVGLSHTSVWYHLKLLE